jgi:glycosyl transferase, family 25
MEDDVRFASDIGTRIRLLDKLPDNWDMLYLGHSQLPAKKTVWSGDGLVHVGASSEFIGTHCYAVNGGAIRKLAEFLELVLSRDKGDPDGGPMPVDGAINTARRSLGLTAFAMIPPLAYQRSSPTDIGNKKWFDQIPVFREAANLSRTIKNAMIQKR